MMYLDALEFLEEERDAFRPFEALDDLTDEQLQVPLVAAHGWSGRDLMGHLIGGLEICLAAARELAVNESSPSMVRWNEEWDAGGDAMNERLLREWAALPMAEVRERFRDVPGELRGTLTVVPETRWLKHKTHMEWFMGETIDHYVEHEADLAAVLAAAGAGGDASA
jgi:hypothetical protein